jgi:hypothetical protein
MLWSTLRNCVPLDIPKAVLWEAYPEAARTLEADFSKRGPSLASQVLSSDPHVDLCPDVEVLDGKRSEGSSLLWNNCWNAGIEWAVLVSTPFSRILPIGFGICAINTSWTGNLWESGYPASKLLGLLHLGQRARGLISWG